MWYFELQSVGNYNCLIKHSNWTLRLLRIQMREVCSRERTEVTSGTWHKGTGSVMQTFLSTKKTHLKRVCKVLSPLNWSVIIPVRQENLAGDFLFPHFAVAYEKTVPVLTSAALSPKSAAYRGKGHARDQVLTNTFSEHRGHDIQTINREICDPTATHTFHVDVH